jgi:colanic acid biosynthesis glycosyl transferase WcaI
MKKILIYSLNFSPELTGIGKYNGEMAAWLVGRGFDVRVICAPPYYPAWKILPPYRWYRWSREYVGGVLVLRSPIWVPKKPGGMSRIVHLFSFAISSFPSLLWQLRWKPDIVWFVVPSLAYAPSALLLSRLVGARLWCHVQDFEVDAAFDLGIVKWQLLRRVILAAEHWLYRQCDVVSTISSKMCDRATAKGVEGGKVNLIPNWVGLHAFLDISAVEISRYREELALPRGKLIVLYSGNMGAKQGLELLPRVARVCLTTGRDALKKLHFVFCGEGPTKESLMSNCNGLENVTFLSLQPAEKLPAFLSIAAIHLLPQRVDAEDLVMPSKLTGMLASGRPVIATAGKDSELARVVEGCGICVPPDDHMAIVDALNCLLSDTNLRSRLGARARERALDYFEKETVLEKMITHEYFR